MAAVDRLMLCMNLYMIHIGGGVDGGDGARAP